jgi:hypothetical protein
MKEASAMNVMRAIDSEPVEPCTEDDFAAASKALVLLKIGLADTGCYDTAFRVCELIRQFDHVRYQYVHRNDDPL